MDLFPLNATGSRSIRVLPARLDREQAVAVFTGGVVGQARQLMHGPLRSVARVSIPFRSVEVIIGSRRQRERMVLGVDAIAGILDLYRFDEEPSAPVVQIRTRNDLEPVLSPAAARDIAAARVRRMLYRRVGFFAIRNRQLDVRSIEDVLYVPYWIGFFGRGDRASIVAIDAVRRQTEGLKVRRLIEMWLARPARVERCSGG